jgi:glycosyltransferase involved in cell wall biosynthesis
VIRVGIDGANLGSGGAITHLSSLLGIADPARDGFSSVVLWAGRRVLEQVDDRPWLEKVSPHSLSGGIVRRSLWQHRHLPAQARAASVDILFVPGGSFSRGGVPIVTMSRNLLPFDMREIRRAGSFPLMVKLLALRVVQTASLRRAEGVIFLTNFSRQFVMRQIGFTRGTQMVIPHGIDDQFFLAPRPQNAISAYSVSRPLRILYVSTVYPYKHQVQLTEAVALLRRRGLPVVLELIGGGDASAVKSLHRTIEGVSDGAAFVCHVGALPHSALPPRYQAADIFAFPSSCENMPNILLEAMASGLPIACARRGPMPEILGAGGEYFDPDHPTDIADALQRLIVSPELRERHAKTAYEAATKFSWTRCATETFRFLRHVAVESNTPDAPRGTVGSSRQVGTLQ